MKYDYLIVGAGLFGAVFAHEAIKKGKKVLVIDKRSHIGGNCYTKEIEGIQVHQYGAHIFHTSNQTVWNYINQFADFNRFTNAPIANYKGELFHLPFNMNTFYQMWGVITPEEAKNKIAAQIKEAGITAPKNLEEQAICLVGKDIYEKLVKGYTEKQWGKKASELPAFIIRRLPVRFTYDDNYFNDTWQGIPIGGYTQIIEKMLRGAQLQLNVDFLQQKKEYLDIADHVIYTGMIDEYYEYCFGELEYRSLRFQTEVVQKENFQGNAVMNYTEYEIPHTRIIEHKHFEFGCSNDKVNPWTVITREYPATWNKGDEPYYPVNNEHNNQRYDTYKKLSEKEEKIIFGGRLGFYQYFDMDQIIARSLELSQNIIF